MADVPEAMRDLAAAHEAGHAIVAFLSPFPRIVQEVTIDKVFYAVVDLEPLPTGIDRTDYLFHNCCVRLAGLAGESAALGKCRSGSAGDDLMKALADANNLLAAVGWAAPVSAALRALGGDRGLDIGSMFTMRPPLKVCRCLDAAYLSSRRIVETHRPAFDRLRLALREEGHLDLRQLTWLISLGRSPP